MTGKNIPTVTDPTEEEMWEDYKRTWPDTLADNPG